MTKRPLLFAALALCVPLAGCGGYRGIETAHQPVVTQADYMLDLLAGTDDLAAGEAQRLGGWLDALAPAPGAAIAIDGADASPGARAEVASLAAERGLRLRPVAASPGTPPAPGMVRVVVTRSSASVPSCDMPAERSTLVNFDAHASSGFGCAVNGTLAAMVAYPDDLVRGRPDDGAGTAGTAAKAIGTWRRAAPTGGGGTILKTEATGTR